MKNYPTIQSTTISFYTTILGSIIPNIADRIYTLNSSSLQFSYEPFKVLPEYYNAGESIIEGFIYTGD
jgi:hypothetical protein